MNNLYNNSQHGFRKTLGTGTPISLFYEAVEVRKADRLRMNVALRDISEAFDKIWHRGLHYKIGISGFPDYVVRIIYSYLKGGVARIRIGDYTSEQIKLLSEVPRGGCLSPTLFNFYTHDVPVTVDQSLNIIYADDITQIVSYARTQNMLDRTIANEVERINVFEKNWKI